MKRGDLVRYLEQLGCKLEREGSRHSIYRNPANGKQTTVPRHMEIDNRLARTICKQLGVPPNA
jgi:mRNA interferase HicA